MSLGLAVLVGLPARAAVDRPVADTAVEESGPTGEVRGLWVTRTSLNSPKSIDAVVRAAETGGFNALMVQIRGRGEAYYRSDVEPRPSDLDGQPVTFDPLGYTLAAAHRAGLRVHAWVNVDLVSSAATLPRSREHVVSRHPEWLMVPKSIAAELRAVDVRSPGYVGQLARWTRAASTTVEGLYLSPIPQESQDYTVSVINELVSRYQVDGLHLDYARYPNELFDYSGRALAEFRSFKAPSVSIPERQRLDQAALKDPSAWANMFPGAWDAFRRDRLTTLIRRVQASARTARPEIIVSAAVSPDALGARTRLFQDWSAWASSKLIDVICPMAYTSNLGEFSNVLTRVRNSAAGVPVWAGIGAWQLPADRTVEHVRAARRAGMSGVLLFSYDALAANEPTPSAYFANLRQAFLGTKPE